jgi:hypothetical protein
MWISLDTKAIVECIYIYIFLYWYVYIYIRIYKVTYDRIYIYIIMGYNGI